MGNINAITLASVIAALASGLFALVGVVVTSILAKRREHETEWRKTRLEHYREYVVALSGITQGRLVSAQAHERYADAVNSLMLVAPPLVLETLYALLAETASQNRSGEVHDRFLNNLLTAMRSDVQPVGSADIAPPPFRLTTVPPLTYREKLEERARDSDA